MGFFSFRKLGIFGYFFRRPVLSRTVVRISRFSFRGLGIARRSNRDDASTGGGMRTRGSHSANSRGGFSRSTRSSSTSGSHRNVPSRSSGSGAKRSRRSGKSKRRGNGWFGIGRHSRSMSQLGSESLEKRSMLAVTDAPGLALGLGVGDGATGSEALQSGGVVTARGDAGFTVNVVFTGTNGTITKTLTGTGVAEAVVLQPVNLTELGEGVVTVTARQIDGFGTTSPQASTSFRLDTTAPSAPLLALATASIGTGATAAEATDAAVGVVTVTGEVGAAIAVTFTGTSGTPVMKNVVGTGAAQPVALAAGDLTTLGDGLVNVSATQTDSAGNPQTAPAAATSFRLDTTAPGAPVLVLGPAITDPVSRAKATQFAGVVTVTGEVNAGITVTFTRAGGGTVQKNFTATGIAQPVVLDATDLNTLGDGLVSVSAVQVDAASNVQTAPAATTSFTLDATEPAAPVIQAATDLSGVTAAEATTALITINNTTAGNTITCVVKGALGIVTRSFPSTGGTAQPFALLLDDLPILGEGGANVTVTQTDPAGNTSAGNGANFVLDFTAPAAPGITLGTGVATNGANAAEATQASGVVTVTGDPGRFIDVTFTGTNGTVSKTVTANGLTIPAAVVLSAGDLTTLGDGVVTVSAVIGDVAGNVSTPTTTFFTLNTFAPAAPGLTLGTGVANGATQTEATQASGVVTVTGSLGNTITVVFTGQSGSVTKIVIGNGATPVEVQLDTVNVGTLGNGNVAVSATETTTAGNTSTATTSSFRLDTVAPAAPLLAIATASIGTGATAAEATDAAVGVVTVTGEVGAAIAVTFTGTSGTPVMKNVVGTGAAQPVALAAGDLTTLGDGLVNVSATQTDSAGNPQTAPAAATSFRLDTTAPGAPVLVLGPAITDPVSRAKATQFAGVVTVTGEVNAGITVTFTRAGGGTVQKNFTATGIAQPVVLDATDLNTLGDGLVSVSAVQVDAASNVQTAPAATTSFTLDATEPATPTVVVGTGVSNGATQAEATQIAGVVTVGNTTSGNTVIVTFTCRLAVVTKSFTSTGGSNRPVALDPSDLATLGEGNVDVSVTQADPAGNISSAATTFFTLDTLPPAAPGIALGTGVAINGATLSEATQASGVVTVTGEVGAAITVTFTRGLITVPKTVTGAGNSTPVAVILTNGDVATLGDGSIGVSATQTDAAGNAQTVLAAQTSFTLATTAPAAPTIAFGTSVTDPVNFAEAVSGGGVVTVQAVTGNTVAVTFARAGGGTVTVPVFTADGTAQPIVLTATQVQSLGSGTVTVSATQTDTAGNTSTIRTLNFTLDATAPVTPSLALGAGVSNGATAAKATQLSGVVTISGGVNGNSITVTFTGTSGPVTKTFTGTGGTAQPVLLLPGDLTTLGNGTVTVTATQLDSTGTPTAASLPVSFTLDTAAPAAPTLVLGPSITSPVGIAAAQQAGGVVTVTGEANAAITVTFSRGVNTVQKTLIGTGVVQAVQLSLADVTLLGSGTVIVTAAQIDAAGNAQAVAATTLSFTLSATTPGLPTLALGSSVLGGATQAEATQVSGVVTVTGVNGNTASVTFTGIGGTVTKSQVAMTGAAVAIALTATDVATLGNGTVNVAATQTDSAGNSSSAASTSFTLDAAAPGAPGIALGAGVANGANATEATQASGVVTVTGESGSTIVVTFTRSGSPVTKSVTGAGNSTPVAVMLTAGDVAALGDGTITVSATQTDAAGNGPSTATATSFVLKTVVTVVPVITGATDNYGSVTGPVPSGGVTNDTTLTISGTAEPLSSVQLFNNGAMLGAPVIADATGNWTTTPATPAGAYALTAISTDANGNLSTASAAYTLTVDGTGPTGTTITSIIDDALPVTGTVTAGGSTNDTALTISGTAEANSTVNVYANASLVGTTTANASGNWTLTTAALAAGFTTFTATATDAAGNSGATSAGVAVIIDITAPAAPAITSVTDNFGTVTGSVANGYSTDDNTPTLTGTAEANSTVTIYDGATLLGAATTSNTGTWGYTTGTLAQGPHSFTVTATDAAGNISATSNAYAITIDTDAPQINSVTVANGIFRTGQLVVFTITFSETVRVSTALPSLNIFVGTSSFTAGHGILPRTATYLGGSNSNTLTFGYTVEPGTVIDNDVDGISYTLPLNLNGGAIRDLAGNDLNSLGGGGSLSGAFLMPTIATATLTTLNNPLGGTTGQPRATPVPVVNIAFDNPVPFTGVGGIGYLSLADFELTRNGALVAIPGTVLLTQSSADQLQFQISNFSPVTETSGTYIFTFADRQIGPEKSITWLKLEATPGPLTATLSATPVATSPRITPVDTISVLFSENVTGVDISDFTLTLNGNPVALTGIAVVGSGSTYSISGLAALQQAGGTAIEGSYRLQLTDKGGIQTYAGGQMIAPVAATWDYNLRPTIVSVTKPVDGLKKVGEELKFTVNFSERVFVTGNPSLSLQIGGKTAPATYVSGTSTTALVFSYTIVSGDEDLNGVTFASTSVLLGSGTIKDEANNDASLAFAPPAMTGVLVDASSPAALSVTPPLPGIYTTGADAKLEFTVNFSDVVNVVTAGGTPSMPITIGGITRQARYDAALSSGSNAVFSYTIVAGDSATGLAGSVTVGAAIALNGGTIRDINGNDASLTLPATTVSNVVVNRIAATVVATPKTYKLGDVIELTATFTQPVNVVGAATIQGTVNTTTGTRTLTFTYASGTGTSTIKFRAPVVANDLDTDGIDVNGAFVLGTGITIRDLAGNDVAPAFDPSGTNGVLVDGVAPAASSVAPPNPGVYTTGSVLTFTVNFNDVVNVVTTAGNPSMPITIGGITRQATYASGTGTSTIVFSYQLGSGDSASGLANSVTVGSAIALNGGTIRDINGNDASLTLPATTVSNVVVNRIAATVVATPKTYKLGDVIELTATFTQPVNVVGAATIQGTVNTTTGTRTLTFTYASGTGTSTIKFRAPVVAGDLDTDGIDVNGTFVLGTGITIKDFAGNDVVPAFDPSAITGVRVDSVAPTVTSVAVPANATYKAGDVLTFTFTLSDPLYITGSPTLPVTIGSNVRTATLVPNGVPLPTLTFAYTVLPTDVGPTAISLGALSLGTATVRDVAGNDANLSYTPVNTSLIQVDGARPTVTGISVPGIVSGSYTTGKALTIQASFSEAVVVQGPLPTLRLNSANGRVATYASGSGTNSLLFTYVVQAGDTSADLDYVDTASLILAPGSTIRDLAGNDADVTLAAPGGVNSLGFLNDIVIDTTAPSVVRFTSSTANGIYNAGKQVQISAVLTEPVAAGGKFDVTLDTGAIVSLATNGTTTATGIYTIGAGENSADLTIIDLASGTAVDAAGNPLTVAIPASPNNIGDAKNIVIDTVAPTVTIASDKTALKIGEFATLTFTLSEPTSNFTLTDVTVKGGTLSPLAGSGSTYTATFTPSANSTDTGTISVAADAFTDAAGNGNAAASLPSPIAIDTVAPFASIATSATTLRAGQTATVTFTLSEASPDFPTAPLKVTGGTLSTLTGSGTSYSAIFTPTPNSTVSGGITIEAKAFTDTAGNANVASSLATPISIDTVIPSAPAIALGSGVGDGATLAEATQATGIVTVSGEKGSLVTVTFSGSGSSGNTVESKVYSDDFASQQAAWSLGFDMGRVGVTPNASTGIPISDAQLATANAASYATISTGSLRLKSNAGGGYDWGVAYASLGDRLPDNFRMTFSFSKDIWYGANLVALSNAPLVTNGLGEIINPVLTFGGGGSSNQSLNLFTTGVLTSSLQAPSQTGFDYSGTKPYQYEVLKEGNRLQIWRDGVLQFDYSGTEVTDNARYLGFYSKQAGAAMTVDDLTIYSRTQAAGTVVKQFVATGKSQAVALTSADVTALGDGPIVANTFQTDPAGNNSDTASVNLAIDTVAPTVAISADRSTLKIGETTTVTFTLSEPSTTFTAATVTAIGGSLSGFGGSGNLYTAVFTPSVQSKTAGWITVAANRFTDAAGNANVAGSLATPIAIDTIAPTVAVTSNAASLNSTGVALITFTLSEASTNFSVGDVVVTNGSLSAFTAVSGTVYTATFNPTANVTGTATIAIPAGSFTDAAGNDNLVGGLVTPIAIDTIAPFPSIASNVSALKIGESATITFTLSEASTTFSAGDVVVTNGSLLAFTALSSTVYTATFTPAASFTGTATITIPAGAFTDAAGNQNTSGATSLAVNTVAPTVAIASSSYSLASGQTAVITFTLSSPSTNFAVGDVTVNGGSIASFAPVSPTVYTAVFTPTPGSTSPGSIVVGSATFTDASGNANLAGGLASPIAIDTVAPTVSIKSSLASLGGVQTATISFTLSEASTTFTDSDVVVTGGTLSGFSGSGTGYNAIFTPAAGSTADGTISVPAGAFTDAFGNTNTASAVTTITVDTFAPKVTVSSSTASVGIGGSATITFTLSEASTTFVAGDVATTNGTLSAFTALSGTVYTAIFTPTSSVTGTATITVPAGSFTDAAGNQNTSGTTSLAVNTVAPTIAIAANKSALKIGDTATITFRLSKPSSDFKQSDVSVSGGTLSNFSGAGTDYFATFTPTADSTAPGLITVAASTFADDVGNGNLAGALSAPIAIDTIAPTISITTSTSAIKRGETATLSFTLSEPSTTFTVGDVTVTGGIISGFTGSGTIYSATFTPTTNSTAPGVIVVPANAFTDAAGNGNVAGSLTPSITIDTVASSVTITASKSALKSGDTSTIAFTLSESATDFTAADVTVTGGTLSGFTGSGSSYTATFTPSGSSTKPGVVSVAANTFTDPAGNGNVAGQLSPSLSIDTVAPTILITSSPTALKIGDTATMTFTLSEASTTFSASSVVVTNGTLSAFTALSSTVYTATFTPATSFTGTATVTVPAGSFTDTAGNANAQGSLATPIAIDTSAPSVVSFGSPVADGTYATGAAIPIVATMSEPVQAGSAISVTLSTGAIVRLVALSQGATLTGTYTVSPGETSFDLDVISYSLTGNVVRDLAGNAHTTPVLPDTAGRLATLKNIAIDASIRVTSGASFSTNPNIIADKRVAVAAVPINFSTPVAGVTLSGIRLFFNGRSISLKGASITGSGANYVLRIPVRSTTPKGFYSVQILPTTGIHAISNGAAMTQTLQIFWGNGRSLGMAPTVRAKAFGSK